MCNETIASQEAELESLRLQLREQTRTITEQQIIFSQQSLQLRAIQTLTAGLLEQLTDEQVFGVACRDLAYSIQGGAAVGLQIEKDTVKILSSVGMNQGQLRQIKRDCLKTPAWSKVYSTRQSVATSKCPQPTALALRVLFNADEVAAVPVMYADQLFGYIVVVTNGQTALAQASQDLSFLNVVARLAGQAVENGQTFLHLEARNTRLHELDELKDGFISIVSHQLRTPLSIIKWILATIDEEPILEDKTKIRDLLAQANIGNERVIHIVNDLINVSQAESGRLPYNPQCTDVASILKNVVESIQEYAHSKELIIISTISKTLPSINVDSRMLRQAFQNLVDNALSYATAGTEVLITAEMIDNMCTIKISDHGLSIPPEQELKIFNQFYRSAEAVRLEPNGNGLGLYLSQAIAVQHGGKIFVKSTVDGDVVFTLTLPCGLT